MCRRAKCSIHQYIVLEHNPLAEEIHAPQLLQVQSTSKPTHLNSTSKFIGFIDVQPKICPCRQSTLLSREHHESRILSLHSRWLAQAQ